MVARRSRVSGNRATPVGRAGGVKVSKKRGPGPVKAYGESTRATVKPGQRVQRAKATSQGRRSQGTPTPGQVRKIAKKQGMGAKGARTAKRMARKTAGAARKKARRKPTPKDFSRHM